MPFFDPSRAELSAGIILLRDQLSDALMRINGFRDQPLSTDSLQKAIKDLHTVVDSVAAEISEN